MAPVRRALIGAVVAAAWLAVGVISGLAEYLTVLRPLGQPLSTSVRGPLLASALWVPLTFAIAAGARRWPAWPLSMRALLLHGTLAIGTSFALNLLWVLVEVLLGGVSGTPSQLARWAGLAAVRFLHMNAGTYLVIVAFVTLWRERRGLGRIPGPLPRAAGAPASGVLSDGRGRTPPGSVPAWADTLAVRIGSRTRVITIAEIVWIEGAGDYARVHVEGASSLASERLKDLERRLDPSLFARVHRSAIVNLTRIRALQHRSHGDYIAYLDEGSAVKVSRSRRDAIAALLGNTIVGRDATSS